MTRERRRRQYGTGAVYQRKDGRWMGVIEAGWNANGTRRRITVSAKTETAAKDRLKDKQRQIAREGMTEASARTTVKGWAEQWLPAAAGRLRPQSYNATASAVRRWIVPTIGHRRLDQLSPGDVRAVADAQRKAGRSSSTVVRTHAALLSLLRAAMIEGHQVPARVLLVKPAAPAVSDRAAMTIPEALAVLAVASTHPDGSRWAVALLHGMRQAECLGLTWEAVHLDTDAPYLVVEWQLQPLPYNVPRDRSSGFRIPDGYEAGHLVEAFHLTRPKSKKGSRVVPLVPAMAEALATWREVAPETPHGLVWPTPDGRPRRARDDLAAWHDLQRAAEVAHPSGRLYHLHEARHVTATQLMEAGADDTSVTAIMGHSSIITSRGYMHTSTAASLEALQRVAERLQIGG